MFIPNWQRQGFKTKEEGIAHVLAYLKHNEKAIVSHGFGEATVLWGNFALVLKGKTKSKKAGDAKK